MGSGVSSQANRSIEIKSVTASAPATALASSSSGLQLNNSSNGANTAAPADADDKEYTWEFDETGDGQSWVALDATFYPQLNAAWDRIYRNVASSSSSSDDSNNDATTSSVNVRVGKTLFVVNVKELTLVRGSGGSGSSSRRVRRRHSGALTRDGSGGYTRDADSSLSAHEPNASVLLGNNNTETAQRRSSTSTAQPVMETRPHDGAIIYTTAFSLDGKSVLTATREGHMSYWEIESGFVSMDFMPCGATVLRAALSQTTGAPIALTGCDDTHARLWRLGERVPAHVLNGHKHKVYGATFMAGDRTAATGSMDNDVRLWDVEQGRCLATHTAHTSFVFAVCSSRTDSNLCLSAGNDNILIRHDFRTSSNASGGSSGAQTFKGHTNAIWGCDTRADDTMFVSAGMDNRALLWDARQTRAPVVVATHQDHVHCVEFLPEGQQLLTSCKDGSWSLWDLTSSSLKNNNTVASANGPPADVEECSPTPITETQAHSGPCYKVTYHPMCNRILSVGRDSVIRLWSCSR